ncbi:MAG: cytochrome b/b6 domain-containing protein [Dehalococcoidia bacterium]|nr:cytochrome b/b6 domain-containing protein [Dehalococcoidia bacterium]
MPEPREVERFKKRTVWFHWIHTTAFIALIVTGAILFFPGIGAPAAGGVTRVIHRIAVVIFVVAPVVYCFLNPKMVVHFIKETLTWGKDDIEWAQAAPIYYFGGAEEKMPPQGHVNTGQKMWQVIVLGTGVLFLVSGFVMWFLKDIVSPGIFQWSVIIHDVAFLLAFLMLLVHIYLGVIHPRMTESLRSMWDGKISEKYARSHYGKWYEEIPKSEE